MATMQTAEADLEAESDWYLLLSHQLILNTVDYETVLYTYEKKYTAAEATKDRASHWRGTGKGMGTMVIFSMGKVTVYELPRGLNHAYIYGCINLNSGIVV